MIAEEVAAFEATWCYITYFPIDDVSMQQLTELRRKILFHRACHIKQTALPYYSEK
jgi:uncharacterized protein (DUF427 family)